MNITAVVVIFLFFAVLAIPVGVVWFSGRGGRNG